MGLAEEKMAKKRVKFETLLDICDAKEKGLIKARNILKMDSKVNQSITKMIRETNPANPKLISLKEVLMSSSAGIRRMSNLPAVSGQQTQLLTAKPSDSLTDDLLDEKQRVHDFLF